MFSRRPRAADVFLAVLARSARSVAVRRAMARERRKPPSPVARRIWKHDATGWRLVYDVGHDARYD